MGIPKRLIHVWGSIDGATTRRGASLPLGCRASLVNATLLHADYDHLFLDDAAINRLLEEDCREYRDVYSRFPLAVQRFDFIRYLAVYRFGGFYFDLDVYLARSLEPLRQHQCVFPFEELTLSRYLRRQHGWDWEVGNYAFGAEAGHPFIRAVIDNCRRSLDDPSWALQVMAGIPTPFRRQFQATSTTGPGLVTRTLAEQPELRNTVSILFPEDVRDTASWHRFGDYGVHLMNASWRRADGPVRRRLARVWEERTRIRLARESEPQGPTRVGDWHSTFPAPFESSSSLSQDTQLQSETPCQY